MKIIGFAGKKQSGKDTLGNFICRNAIELFGKISNGKALGHELYEPPIVFKTAFADELKEFCMKYLDLTHLQCYGSNDDKNTKSKIRWKDVPDFYEKRFQIEDALIKQNRPLDDFMTAREILQQAGSNWFRRMKDGIWCDLLTQRIKNSNADIVVVCDTRFPDEVECLKNLGGKVIKLTRGNSEDKHISETALDEYTAFDAVLDNKNMTVTESEQALVENLNTFGWTVKL